MRVDSKLVRLIANAAISEPFRQTGVLTTRDFVKFLDKRGISLRWSTIHHLWELGVLHPIAVLEPAITPILDKHRFERIDLHMKFQVMLI